MQRLSLPQPRTELARGIYNHPYTRPDTFTATGITCTVQGPFTYTAPHTDMHVFLSASDSH